MKKKFSFIIMLALVLSIASCGKKKDGENASEGAEAGQTVTVEAIKNTSSLMEKDIKYVNLEDGSYQIQVKANEGNVDKPYIITVALKFNVNPGQDNSELYSMRLNLLNKNEESIRVTLSSNKKAERLITEALRGSEGKVVEVEFETELSADNLNEVTSKAKYIQIDSLTIFNLPSDKAKDEETTVVSSSSVSIPDYSDVVDDYQKVIEKSAKEYQDAVNKSVDEYQKAVDKSIKDYQDQFDEAKRNLGL